MTSSSNDRFFVHVIESPGDIDLLDGRTEGRVLVEALNLSQVPVAYNLVVSRRTLDEALGNRLAQAAAFFQRIPVLHLSLHGNDQGIGLIGLTDQQHFISWHEFRELLLPINQRLGGALLVCLSSCFGAAGCRMAMYENQPIPFVALVGHPDSASWSDAAVAFVTFYHRLQGGANVFEAVEAMKAASGDSRFLVFVGSDVQADFVRYLQELRIREALDNLMTRAPRGEQSFDAGVPGTGA